jgi:hypothetical protein
MEQTIYDELKSFNFSVNSTWRNKGHSNTCLNEYIEVYNEVERIKQEINSLMNGKLLEAEVSHYDDEGNKIIDSEAVYYNPTTQVDLIAQIESDLDVADVLEVMKAGRTWTQFKDSFNLEE